MIAASDEMKKRIVIVVLVAAHLAQALPGRADTLKQILEKYGHIVALDEGGTDELIVELGHEKSSRRRAALQKARTQLDYPALMKLVPILAASDDPELCGMAEELTGALEQKVMEPYAEAIDMAKKALDGDAYAQGVLASMFRRPECGLETNPEEALRWAQKSADQKHAMGLYALACLYDSGCGVTNDAERAEELFVQCVDDLRKEADGGDTRARCNLGWLLKEGRGGLHTNVVEGVKWYTLAAEQGYVRAQRVLGDTYRSGQDLATNEAAALIWYGRAASQGCTWALYRLGQMHYNGEGVRSNAVAAAKYYRKSAVLGLSHAQFHFGWMCRTGTGVEKNDVVGVKWYQKAAEQGHAGAQCNLGYAYKHGLGVNRDDRAALRWYTLSAERGNAAAQCELGMHYRWNSTQKDLDEALKWYLKAARQGNVIAQCCVGEMYALIPDFRRDYKEAIEWYTQAAEGGFVNACNNLAWLYATCPDAKFRDGKKAVHYALKAYTANPSHSYHAGTLAASYARDGQFEKAVKTQEEAIRLLAPTDPEGDEIVDFRERLKLYKQGKAYSEITR
jgi:TPR repeat protein